MFPPLHLLLPSAGVRGVELPTRWSFVGACELGGIIAEDDRRGAAQVSCCWNRRVTLSRCDTWASNLWPCRCLRVAAPPVSFEWPPNKKLRKMCLWILSSISGGWVLPLAGKDLLYSDKIFLYISKIWGMRRQLFVKYFRIIPWPTFIALPWKKASLNSSTCLYRRPLPENEFPSFSKKTEPLRTAAPFQKWFPNNVVMPRLPGDPSLKQAALVFIITPAKYKEHGCFFDSKDYASCVSGRLHPL